MYHPLQNAIFTDLLRLLPAKEATLAVFPKAYVESRENVGFIGYTWDSHGYKVIANSCSNAWSLLRTKAVQKMADACYDPDVDVFCQQLNKTLTPATKVTAARKSPKVDSASISKMAAEAMARQLPWLTDKRYFLGASAW